MCTPPLAPFWRGLDINFHYEYAFKCLRKVVILSLSAGINKDVEEEISVFL
jgi:hypothetical protein